MFHLLRHLSALGISSILFTHSHATPITTNVGGIFDVNFYNNGDSVACGLLGTYTSDKDWTQEQMNSLNRALETWDAIIDNTPGRNMTVSVFWQNQGAGYLASATSSNKFTMGLGGETPSYVERIWKGGETISTTAKEPDIIIVCNSYNYNNYYYGEATTGVGSFSYDFQTIMTHELGHAIGFKSLFNTENSDGTYAPFIDGNGASHYTPFDALMVNEAGDSLIESKNLTLGETIYLKGTDLTVFNPSAWMSGSSLAHIDDPDALMYFTVPYNGFMRTPTESELELLSVMGWDINPAYLSVPEPSSTSLLLIGCGLLLYRRNRTSSK